MHAILFRLYKSCKFVCNLCLVKGPRFRTRSSVAICQAATYTYDIYLRHIPPTYTYDIYIRHISTIYDIYLRHIPTTYTYDIYIRHMPTTYTYDIYLRHITTTYTYDIYLLQTKSARLRRKSAELSAYFRCISSIVIYQDTNYILSISNEIY